MSSDMSAHNEPISIYPEGSVSWDEAWRQRQRADALEADVERLNQMLRATGYGQGQIDAYVAQCEEIDGLRRELAEAAITIQRMRAEMNPPYVIGVKESGVTVDETIVWVKGE